MRIRCAVLLTGVVLAGQVALAQSPETSRLDRKGGTLPNGPAERLSQAPTVPVILDGVEYPVGKLPRTAAALAYVLTAEDQEKGVVHAFSSMDSAAAFMHFAKENGQAADGSAQEAVGYCAHPYIYSVFNKVRGGGGEDNLIMVKQPWPYAGESYWDLDFEGWNNTISWVAAACVTHWTTLYSCRGFDLTKDYFCQDPAIMFIEGGLIVPDLMPYGMNNRASSLRFCRFPEDDPYNPCIEE